MTNLLPTCVVILMVTFFGHVTSSSVCYGHCGTTCTCTTPSSFQCADGTCIPYKEYKDYKFDCPDHSDEAVECCSDQMKCDTTINNIGKCVAATTINDNKTQCIDLTDESKETEAICNTFIQEAQQNNTPPAEYFYQCQNSSALQPIGKCILVTKILNGEYDCPNGEDEDPSAIDECAMNIDDCDPVNGICTRLSGGGYECSCPPGFWGDGYNCTPSNDTQTTRSSNSVQNQTGITVGRGSVTNNSVVQNITVAPPSASLAVLVNSSALPNTKGSSQNSTVNAIGNVTSTPHAQPVSNVTVVPILQNTNPNGGITIPISQSGNSSSALFNSQNVTVTPNLVNGTTSKPIVVANLQNATASPNVNANITVATPILSGTVKPITVSPPVNVTINVNGNQVNTTILQSAANINATASVNSAGSSATVKPILQNATVVSAVTANVGTNGTQLNATLLNLNSNATIISNVHVSTVANRTGSTTISNGFQNATVVPAVNASTTAKPNFHNITVSATHVNNGTIVNVTVNNSYQNVTVNPPIVTIVNGTIIPPLANATVQISPLNSAVISQTNGNVTVIPNAPINGTVAYNSPNSTTIPKVTASKSNSPQPNVSATPLIHANVSLNSTVPYSVQDTTTEDLNGTEYTVNVTWYEEFLNETTPSSQNETEWPNVSLFGNQTISPLLPNGTAIPNVVSSFFANVVNATVIPVSNLTNGPSSLFNVTQPGNTSVTVNAKG